MKPNTVLLALETYNELRDFKKQIEECKTLVFYEYNSFSSRQYSFMSNDEALLKANEININMAKEISKLIEQMNDSNKAKEISINDIKKMSYWEFRKWKNK